VTLGDWNRVRGARAWFYGLRVRDSSKSPNVLTFAVHREADGVTLRGIRASGYRTTTLARKMNVRDLPGYQSAALAAIREFEANERG
jgi:hypothetical protein